MDVTALVALLAEDATFAAEPAHRYLALRANGQLADAAYRWNEEKRCFVAQALEVITVEGARVKTMTAFMTPGLFPRFGLPGALPVRSGG